MPQVLKQPVTRVVTKDGECVITIALELTINLNSDGIVAAASTTARPVEQNKVQAAEDERVDWMLPDLGRVEKIKFGKTVGE